MTKKICILAGARPNFVKVAPLVRAISGSAEAECLLVYAGCEDDPKIGRASCRERVLRLV